MKKIYYFEPWPDRLNINKWLNDTGVEPRSKVYCLVPYEHTYWWERQRFLRGVPKYKYSDDIEFVWITQNGINFDKMKEDFDINEENCKVVNYKTSWFDMSYYKTYTAQHINPNPFDINSYNFEKLFITLNRNAWPHRVYFLDYIFKHGLGEHGYIGNRDPDAHTRNYQYWKNPKYIALHQFEGQDVVGVPLVNVFKLFPPQWYKSVLHLVSETLFYQLWNGQHFFTEKTAFPIIMCKPFLVAGPVGIHAYIEKLGFKLYTNIFDYEFDSMPEQYDRLDGLMTQVKRYINVDLPKLYDECLDIAIYNFNHLRKLCDETRPTELYDTDYLKDYFDKIVLNNVQGSKFYGK